MKKRNSESQVTKLLPPVEGEEQTRDSINALVFNEDSQQAFLHYKNVSDKLKIANTAVRFLGGQSSWDRIGGGVSWVKILRLPKLSL